MSIIVDKQKILSDDCEESNNAQLEEKNLLTNELNQLEDLKVLSLEETRKKLDKKFEKKTIRRREQ